MKKIITISREFGSGGGTIGKRVAERLGYEYYDKDLIFKTAAEANMSPEDAIKLDEKLSHGFGFGQSLFNLYSAPLDEKLYNAQKNIIRKFAEKGNCVIVGRNANIILKEFDKTLHVFIAASEKARLERMMGKMPGYSEKEVLDHLRSVDKARKKYCKHYTQTKFGNAEFYDLCVKSSALGVDKCVDIICDIAKSGN